jgi:hypothetical protein
MPDRATRLAGGLPELHIVAALSLLAGDVVRDADASRQVDGCFQPPVSHLNPTEPTSTNSPSSIRPNQLVSRPAAPCPYPACTDRLQYSERLVDQGIPAVYFTPDAHLDPS